MARKKVVAAEDAPVAPVVPLVESDVVVNTVDGVNYVKVKTPSIGCKSFLVEKKGMYVFEEGEGVLRSIAVTYVGSGGIKIYDAVPSAGGYFDFERNNSPDAATSKGRRMFVMSPQVIGFWGLDAGFSNGLTVVADGGQPSSPVLVTIMWETFKKREVSVQEIEFGEE